MKKLILLFLAMTVICPTLMAQGNQTNPVVVLPKESGLTQSSATPDPSIKASFRGQVWVEGVFIAQWPAELKNLDPKDQIEVSIKLDEKEQKRLPYYEWPEWSRTYIADSVGINNSEEAIKMVFPKEIAEKLLSRKMLAAQVRARFLLSNYAIGIECDSPWASADLISADVSPTASISNETALNGC